MQNDGPPVDVVAGLIICTSLHIKIEAYSTKDTPNPINRVDKDVQLNTIFEVSG